MRDLGDPSDRFRRAVNAGSLPIAEAALREMGSGAGVLEALELLALMARAGDDRYNIAAARWVARVCEERELQTADMSALLAMVALLPGSPELLAVLRRSVSARPSGS